MLSSNSGSRKRYGFSSISNFTLETLDEVDHLDLDGRVELLVERPAAPGGMAWFAENAVRQFAPRVDLAIGGLVGEVDKENAFESVSRLGADTQYLIPVRGKSTNRSKIVSDGKHRLIIRCSHQISFAADLSPDNRRRLSAMVAASRSCLLGKLPLELTRHFIAWGCDHESYVTLGPGGQQLRHLNQLQPHALILNFGEAQEATGIFCDDEERVFGELLERSRFQHVAVMTGNGERPTHVADRLSNRTWKLDPVDLNTISDRRVGALNCLGTGDTMAGAMTFLLGMGGEFVAGDGVLEAVRIGQDAAVAHLTASPSYQRRLLAPYDAVRRSLFDSLRKRAPNVAKNWRAGDVSPPISRRETNGIGCCENPRLVKSTNNSLMRV